MSVWARKGLMILGLTAGLAVWFSVLIPWGKLPDPDAFYHAAMARLTWQQGPVTAFPWLDLTSLGQHFADQHFLFHVIESPFVMVWGLAQGSRISSVAWAVICMLGMAWVFHRLSLRPFWLWTLLLAFTHPFSTRLVLGKASPLAILFWFVGLGATLYVLPLGRGGWRGTVSATSPSFSKDRRFFYGLIFFSSLLFTLTHGGWIILPVSMLVLLLGSIISDVVLDGSGLTGAIRQAPWLVWLTSWLGIAVGLLLHPGRDQLLQLLWIQVVKIGLLAPTTSLPMGQEWDPATLGALLAMTSIFGVILLLCIPGLAFARRQSYDQTEQRQTFRIIIAASLLVACLAALTLKSSRYAEYFQPALVLLTAHLSQLVDWRKLSGWLSLGEGRFARLIFPGIALICSAVILLHSIWNAYAVLHDKPEFVDDQYAGAMQAISDQAQPGDRVYHSQWDEFPVLFAHDQRLKYVAGLDPNFFYQTSSTLAMDYFNLAFHAASSTPDQAWSLIHDRLGAKFVLIDTIRWQDLAKLIDSDARYVRIGEGQGGVAYRLRMTNE